MAEIITPNPEVRTIDAKSESEKKNYKQWLKLYAKGHAFGKLGTLLQIAAIHNIHEACAYKFEKLSWQDYCASINIKKRTADRYLQIANALLKKCPNAVIITDGKFLFDAARIEAEFKDLIKREGEITLESLRAMGGESNELRNFFFDEQAGSDISTANAMAMLTGDSSLEPTPATGGPLELPKQGGLFDLTDRLTKAGYTYDGIKRSWCREDGTEITHEELGELISPADAAEMFGDLKKAIIPAREHFIERKEEFQNYLIAFKKTHRTPMSEDFIKEKFKELQDEMRVLLHEASTLLKEEEG